MIVLGNNTRTWVTGTALLAVVVLIASWLLVIAPQRAETTALRQQTADLVTQQSLLTSERARLEQAASHLPETRSELAALRSSVPATLGISDFTRTPSAAAATGGVTLMSIAPAPPAVDAAGSLAAPAATTGTATTDATGTTAVTPTASDPTASGAVTTGTVENPVTVQVIGSLAGSLVFLRELQQGERAFLVTGLSVTSATDTPASAGRPATKNGDVTLDITGSLFVLPDDAATTSAAAAGATPAN